MESFEEVRKEILTLLTCDDAAARREYLRYFATEVDDFSDATSHAFIKWRTIDVNSRENEKRAYVSALVYMALDLHVLSLKFLLSGHLVAAGNLYRQVIESIALAILCSNKDLGILERFMRGHYSTDKSVRDVERYKKKLRLTKGGIQSLKNGQKFYARYSHPTYLTIASTMDFSEPGVIVMGATFDEGKLDAYQKEVRSRTNLAKQFPNILDGIIANLAEW